MKETPAKTVRTAKIETGRIKLPILAPLFAAIGVLLVTFTVAIYNLQQKHITDDVRMRLDNTRRAFDMHLALDARLLGAATRLIENNQDIQNAWLAGDRDKLLKCAEPLFDGFKNEYRITHLYFIDTNNICFLRVHNPPRYDDYIDRFTLRTAASNHRPFWGIELGVYGTFTLRIVHPWFINDNLAGYIELGEEIEHITPQIKEALDVDIAVLINKSLLKRQTWEEGQKMMGRSGNWDSIPDSIVADSTIPEIPSEFTKFGGLPRDKHETDVFAANLNGSKYRGGFVRLVDAAKKEVGDILVIKNVSGSEASLRALLAIVATLCFLVGAMLISFFYFHITNIEKHLIEARGTLETEIEKRKEVESQLRNHKEHLEDNVRERTAELKETNKHLEDEILERKRAEAALRKSEERFKQVAESAGDWIWEVNAEGLYTYSSPVCEKLLGYMPEEIVGKKYFYDFFTPEVKEEFKKAAFEVFNKRESFTGFINTVIHKNGSTVVLETNGTPVSDDKGNLCGYRGADRDITERNKAQQRQAQLLEQLEKANKSLQQEVEQRAKTDIAIEKLNTDLESTVTQLIQTNRQLSEFAHLAAHDLKTPLRGIGTLAQWLAEDYRGKFDEMGRRQIDLLIKKVERIDKLMDAILQYSTIARNMQNELPEDLNLLFEAVIAEIKCPANIQITVKNKLPVLICEERHIRQVLFSLVDNAVKFMNKPQGRVIIDCTEKDRFWEFSVCDNGPGIEQQHFEKIFTLFQTLSVRDDAENIGVGLTLVRKIVELYGGIVWLKSEVGQGSTFYFTLPKQPGVTAPAPVLDKTMQEQPAMS